jgi:hypothetical protein
VHINLEEAVSDDVTPQLGANTGAEFYRGKVTVSAYQVLVGQSVSVTVNGVDANNANELLDGRYQYLFRSECSQTSASSFSIGRTFSSTNTVSSTYRNLSCTADDTLTVYLFSGDSEIDVTASDAALIAATGYLDKAVAKIRVAKPLIGYGEGAAFNNGYIDGQNVVLEGETEVTFTANVVNPLSANALVSDSDYIVQWLSSCDDAEFSLDSQDLEESTIETRYSTSLNCIDDDDDSTDPQANQIALVLYSRDNADACTDAINAIDWTNAVTLNGLSVCLDYQTFNLDVRQGVDARIGRGENTPDPADSSTFSEGDLLINDGSVTPISAGSTANILANVVDANNSYQKVANRSYGFTVTSVCAEQSPALATFNYTELVRAQGQVSFTYTADGCVGDDEVTVTLYKAVDGVIDYTSELGSATGTVTVLPAEVGAITYTGADYTAISIASIGDAVLPKQSLLTFKVVDKSNNPIEGQTVTFNLTNTVGGISLASLSEVTDADGVVTAILNAGTAHATTSVTAKTQIEGVNTTTVDDDVYIQTSSQPISISTGVADQDSFSIAVDVFNPGAFDVDGETVTVSAFAADQYQNPVADGTVINFTAESGFIESHCLTSGGSCSVTWTSSGTRPGMHDPLLGRVNDRDPQTAASVLGMTTITAYTTGEAGYTDQNGNGQFDYIDIDGNGSFSPADSNGDGIVDTDRNGDGYIDQDINSDDDIDVDTNSDGYADFDDNNDDIIDRDVNGDGFIDVDTNADSVIDVDTDLDGFIDGTADAFTPAVAIVLSAMESVVSDVTEPFVAYPEVFRDDNWNGSIDSSAQGPVEFFADFNEDGEYTAAPDYYQGVVCDSELQDVVREKADDGTYDAHCKYMMHARQSVRIVQSYAEAPGIALYTLDSITGKYVPVSSTNPIRNGVFYVLLQDTNGNIPANGTTMSVSGDGFKISGDSGAVDNSVGLIYNGVDVDLPSFGELYGVSYTPDGVTVSIEVTATYGDSSTSVMLNVYTYDANGDGTDDSIELY